MFKQFQEKFNALTCKSIENFIGIAYLRSGCMATAFFFLFCSASPAQNIPAKTGNDVNMPLHMLQPNYPVVYGKTTIEDVLLAGAEMINLLKQNKFEINDSAVQFAE